MKSFLSFLGRCLKSFFSFLGRHKIAMIIIILISLFLYDETLYIRAWKKFTRFLNITTEQSKEARKDAKEIGKDIDSIKPHLK